MDNRRSFEIVHRIPLAAVARAPAAASAPLSTTAIIIIIIVVVVVVIVATCLQQRVAKLGYRTGC